MFTGIKHKFFAAIGAALAAAAIVASGASAKHVPVDLNNGSEQVTQGYTTAALEALNRRWQAMAEFYGVQTSERQPDGYQPHLGTHVRAAIDRIEAHRPELANNVVAPSVADDVVSRYLRNNTGETTTQFVPSSNDGFDWGIFGIASGSALALIAFCGAALMGVRRGRIAHP
jgi:hypothetical protein